MSRTAHFGAHFGVRLRGRPGLHRGKWCFQPSLAKSSLHAMTLLFSVEIMFVGSLAMAMFGRAVTQTALVKSPSTSGNSCNMRASEIPAEDSSFRRFEPRVQCAWSFLRVELYSSGLYSSQPLSAHEMHNSA